MKHFGMPRAELKRIREDTRKRRRAPLWRWFEARKRARPFAGLAFFQPTNVKGAIVLASRHWPDSITWSWSIWLRTRGRSGRRFLAYSTNSGGNIIFGPIDIHWQEEMPHARTTRCDGDRFVAALRNSPNQAVAPGHNGGSEQDGR